MVLQVVYPFVPVNNDVRPVYPKRNGSDIIAIDFFDFGFNSWI